MVNFGFAALVINECYAIGDGPMRWLVLHFIELKLDEYNAAVGALFGLAVGYRVLSYIVLKLRIRLETSL